MTLSHILKISRPRFWIYELGTFLVGLIAAGTAFTDIPPVSLCVFFVYFLFPANLLIYGVNDVFDYETDKLNKKKEDYEALVKPADQRPLLWIVAAVNAPFVLLAFFLGAKAGIAFAIFLLCAIFYSAPPLRSKTKPVLDSLTSAGHYIATGVFGYYLASGPGIPLNGIIAGLAWAVAMHAFSAVPDINADDKAGLDTIATKLGAQKTIILCAVLYLVAGYIGTLLISSWIWILVIVYVGMMAAAHHYRFNDKKLFSIYKIFPTLNAVTGGIIFLLTLAARI